MAAPVYYLVRHYPGPKWQFGKDFRSQPGIELHISHLNKLMSDGHLLMGGPFLNDQGGAVVLLADDLASARVLAGQDQAVANELLRIEVHPWAVMLDRRKPFERGDPIYTPPSKPSPLDPGSFKAEDEGFDME